MPPDAICDRCPEPAAQSVGSEYLCTEHTDQILDPIRQRIAKRSGFHGWGEPTGPPNHGWSHLTCRTCAATWIGKPYDPCTWCEQARQHVIEHQAEIVLTAPDLDPDDVRYTAAMTAWAERLARAVTAHIINDLQARNAWTRAKRDRSAA